MTSGDNRMWVLSRQEPPRNIARFYVVMIGPSLLDPYAVIRFWGRVGGFQRHQVTPCLSAAEADNLARQLVARRLKRGYKLQKMAS